MRGMHATQGVGALDMRGRGEAASSAPVIGVLDTFAQPGTYSLEVPCPKTRSTATILLEMADSHGVTLTDSFSLSFHMHFHRLLKWLVAVPLLGTALAVLALQPRATLAGPTLPSFRRGHDF